MIFCSANLKEKKNEKEKERGEGKGWYLCIRNIKERLKDTFLEADFEVRRKAGNIIKCFNSNRKASSHSTILEGEGKGVSEAVFWKGGEKWEREGGGVNTYLGCW